MMGRMAAPVMACRINSAWLMLQAESLSANSAYSSSVMRVLTTRLRCGVLYRFRLVKTSVRLPHGCGGISGVSRISRVWGRHSPTRFPQEQNERKANFGTAVESCSKKLPDCRSLATATFSENRNQLFYKRLPDCPHLLLPLFQKIYNQLFHKRLRAGVLPLLPTTPKKAKMTDFPARTFPAARSFPTIRRFGSCIWPAV